MLIDNQRKIITKIITYILSQVQVQSYTYRTLQKKDITDTESVFLIFQSLVLVITSNSSRDNPS